MTPTTLCGARFFSLGNPVLNLLAKSLDAAARGDFFQNFLPTALVRPAALSGKGRHSRGKVPEAAVPKQGKPHPSDASSLLRKSLGSGS